MSGDWREFVRQGVRREKRRRSRFAVTVAEFATYNPALKKRHDRIDFIAVGVVKAKGLRPSENAQKPYRPDAQTRFLENLSDDALSGGLERVELSPRYAPKPVIAPLHQQQVSLVVVNKGICAGGEQRFVANKFSDFF